MACRLTWTLPLALVVLLSNGSLIQASSPLKADFNGDGYADLAIGVPYEDVSGVTDAGFVHVTYGSGSGITTSGSQFFSQGVDGVPDQSEASDLFGYALAAGDFDGDGYADLAIGVPSEDLGSAVNAGAVIVLWGSVNGLTTAGADRWYQGDICWFAGQINGQPGSYDFFGGALATGRFNDDSYDDLAIGAYGETADADNVFGAGAVNVIYGSSVGLNCPGDQLWHQGSAGIADSPENFDYFGYALAAGDFDGDSYDDLAVGVPAEDVGSVLVAGAVNVIRGSASGLIGANDPLWNRDYGSVLGVAQAWDYFGWSLAAGYFNGDVFADLAIGIPYDDVLGVNGAGSVTVLYGSAGGLTDVGNDLWNQATLGDVQTGELFGLSLAAGNFGKGGWDDLAVGVPFDVVSGVTGAGSVNVIYGSASGLTAVGLQLWNQAPSGISDGPEQDDWFGQDVASGDFNGDGYADLAIGAPGEDLGFLGGIWDAGVVHVLKASNVGTGLISSGSLLLDQGMLGDAKESGDWLGLALSR